MPDSPIDFRDVAQPALPTMRRSFDAPITGRYNDPRDGGARRHHALDLAYPEGEPIAVNKPGRVVKRGEDEKSGKFLFIDHGDGTTSSYSHLQGWDAEEGDEIAPGRAFARVGKTATRHPHLHFVVRRNGARVNPEETDIRPMRASAGIDFSDVATPDKSGGQIDFTDVAVPPSADPRRPSPTPQPAGTTDAEQAAGGPEATRPLPTINLRPRVNDFGSFVETGSAQGPRPPAQTPAGFVTPTRGPSIDKPVIGTAPSPVRARVERAKRRAREFREQAQGASPGTLPAVTAVDPVEASGEYLRSYAQGRGLKDPTVLDDSPADKSYALGESPEEQLAARFRFNEGEADEFTQNFQRYKTEHPANVGRGAVRDLERRLADATAAHREERGKLTALRQPGNLDPRRVAAGRQAEEMAAAVQFKPGPAYVPAAAGRFGSVEGEAVPAAAPSPIKQAVVEALAPYLPGLVGKASGGSGAKEMTPEQNASERRRVEALLTDDDRADVERFKQFLLNRSDVARPLMAAPYAVGTRLYELEAGYTRTLEDLLGLIPLPDEAKPGHDFSDYFKRKALKSQLALEGAEKESPLSPTQKAVAAGSAFVGDLALTVALAKPVGATASFGASGFLEARGRGEGYGSAAVAGAKGAATGYLFEATKALPLRQRGAVVFGASYHMGLAAGETPGQAAREAAMNTAFSVVPEGMQKLGRLLTGKPVNGPESLSGLRVTRPFVIEEEGGPTIVVRPPEAEDLARFRVEVVAPGGEPEGAHRYKVDRDTADAFIYAGEHAGDDASLDVLSERYRQSH
jgi:hypothetical protein